MVGKINFLIYQKKESTLISEELLGVVEIRRNTNQLLEEWCLKDGSTVCGRIKAVKHWLKIEKKVPVLINKENQIIFFPTESSKNLGCVWIAYDKVKKLYSVDAGTSKIVFKDNQELVLTINIRVIKKQMMRCRQFIKFLELNESLYEGMKLQDDLVGRGDLWNI